MRQRFNQSKLLDQEMAGNWTGGRLEAGGWRQAGWRLAEASWTPPGRLLGGLLRRLSTAGRFLQRLGISKCIGKCTVFC